jgi:hypothetical protein
MDGCFMVKFFAILDVERLYSTTWTAVWCHTNVKCKYDKDMPTSSISALYILVHCLWRYKISWIHAISIIDFINYMLWSYQPFCYVDLYCLQTN